MNKRGAETTIGTIVVVILAILVLVIVAAGFSIGWKNLWARINIFTPSVASIDAVVAKCDAMCLANQKYSYCCDEQTVKIKENTITKSCDSMKNDEQLPITCETIKCKDEVTCR